MEDIHAKLRRTIPVKADPAIIKFNDDQLKVFWPPDEIKVEKDVQDVLVNFSEAERHGVITTLKLFSLYEIAAGDEFWGGRFKKMYQTNEHHRMASTFAMFENSIHGPFYNKINELLHINNEEFYLSYLDDPDLKARMDHIGEIVSNGSDLETLGVFCGVEGVILYSNFAYLKHFQARGKNKLMNIVRGLNFSLRDENIHSMASAYCFKKKLAEANLSVEEATALEEKIRAAYRKMFEHECAIIKKIFSKGAPDGITELQMVHFVQSRVNECLHLIGYAKEYDVKYNPIAEWFYDAINNFSFNDFFSGIGNSYQRDWDEKAFTWKTQAVEVQQ